MKNTRKSIIITTWPAVLYDPEFAAWQHEGCPGEVADHRRGEELLPRLRPQSRLEA